MSDSTDTAHRNGDTHIAAGGTGIGTLNAATAVLAGPMTIDKFVSTASATVESSLIDYYRQSALDCTLVTLAAVELGQRDVYVDDVYVEPDVLVVDDAKSIHKTGRDRPDGEPNRQPLTTCLNSTDSAMERLVLTARTGFGKSTAVNMRVQWATKAGTPLLMLRLPSLRASASPQSKTKPSERVEAALIQDIHAKNVVKAGDETQLARWLIQQFDAQPGIIMFDALDEVPLTDRDYVVTCVRSFLDGLARTELPHRVLITSRPYAYTEQFAPDNFKRIELAEFTPDQQDALIQKWFTQPGRTAQIGAALTEQLQTARNGANPDQAALATLMSEPMLLTYACMLAEAPSGGKAPSASAASPLPPTRYELFDGVVGLMLEKWDVKRRHGVAEDFKALFTKSGYQPSVLRRILEQAALEELHAQAPPFTTGATGKTSSPKALRASPLTHERLVYRVDAEMPPKLPVRAHAVVDWLAKRSGLLHATKEIDGERYTLQAQLRDFLAVGGLRATVNDEHAFVDALLPHFFGQPEWYRPMLGMMLASLRGTPHALAHAVTAVLSAEEAATDEKPAHALLHFVIAWASAFGASPPWASHHTSPNAQPKPALIQLKTRCLDLVTAPAEGKPPIELRAEAADALGVIGDPRFDPERWHLPAKRMLSKEEEPIPGFVRIAEGDFIMGNKREKNNLPRKVCIESPFYIARYATTVAQFRHFVDASGYEEKQWWDDDGLLWLSGEYDKRVRDSEHLRWLRVRPPQERRAPVSWAHQLQSPSRPVVSVSWFEARAYARWLDRSLHQLLNDSSLSGHRVQLPTEPEWERAARWAPNEKGYDNRRWPWGNDENDAVRHANVDPGLGRAASVGLYESTGPALFDMAGNVWEWMDNAYSTASDARFDHASRRHTWQHALKWLDSEMHSLRGGSWFYQPEHASCSFRYRYFPDYWYYDVGFRVVLSLAKNET